MNAFFPIQRDSSRQDAVIGGRVVAMRRLVPCQVLIFG